MSETARTLTGDLVLPRVIVTDPAQCIRQQIIDGLALWQGEWFLDQNAGFPWFQSVLGIKLVNTTQIEALLRQFLLSIQGVVAVQATVNFNRAARVFNYSYWAALDTGVFLTGGSATPPVISGSP